MRKKVLIIGLLCETFACLYVPMVDLSKFRVFVGYGWLWAGKILDSFGREDYVVVDVSRLVIEMLAIAFLTAIGYLLCDQKINKK